jgi:hypothetical protein
MIRVVGALVAASVAVAAVPEHPLQTLRKGHPRLIATAADFTRLQALVLSDRMAGAIWARLKRQADAIEPQPTVVHRLIGPRLLDQSRRCLERVYTLALVYRISGETTYRDRALKELRAAAAFPDWNPSHFLDVAEMTHAFAIGYDWLYSDLSEEDRTLLRRAIIEKGLDPAIAIYKEHRWWTTVTHNWNQVCNGGIALGALAIADEDPGRAEYIVGQSVDSIRRAINSYAPDGGWAEGPGYWQYATAYTVYYLAGLQTALGTDFGLSDIPGFNHAGDFRIYFQGPTGATFNYADASPQAGMAPEMFWLGRRFKNRVFVVDELRHLALGGRPHALDLVWYDALSVGPRNAGWPLSRMFAGVNVAFLRTDWDKPETLWIAIKGGDNQANHSHLDLGSFVLESGGMRFALDLGGDDYNLPDYFGAKRYTYYRLRTESHNTITIDGENQDLKAKAPMTSKDGVFTIDLSGAYPGKLTRWTRSVWIEKESNAAIIRDDLEAPQPVTAVWGIITDARITLNHGTVLLQKGDAELEARILSPRDAVWDVVTTLAPPPQNPNLGTKKLIVRLSGKATKTRIEVALK